MYEPVRIQQLSLNQAKNLVKGKGVRVKHDPRSPFTVHLSPDQIKKLTRAHKSGKSFTLTLDPYQQEITGKGIFGAKFDRWAKKTFGEKIYHGVEKIGKPLLKAGIKAGTAALGSYVSPAVAARIGQVANAYVDNPSKYNEGPAGRALMNLGKTAITGQGIFGDRVDRMVKRYVGQKGMDVIERTGRPLATKGIQKATALMRSAGVPASIANRLENVAEAYVDDPSAYQSKSGLLKLAKKGISGNGIFGSRFDQKLKSVVGQKGMDIIERTGRPLATRGIKKVSDLMRSAGVPASVANRLENVAEAYIDDPSAYQSKAGLMGLGKIAIKGRGRKRKARGGALFPAGRY